MQAEFKSWKGQVLASVNTLVPPTFGEGALREPHAYTLGKPIWYEIFNIHP